jgi:hypothetical protein
MQDAVPVKKTAWVVTRIIEESEGHSRVCGLLITSDRSICCAKPVSFVIRFGFHVTPSIVVIYHALNEMGSHVQERGNEV